MLKEISITFNNKKIKFIDLSLFLSLFPMASRIYLLSNDILSEGEYTTYISIYINFSRFCYNLKFFLARVIHMSYFWRCYSSNKNNNLIMLLFAVGFYTNENLFTK